MQMKDGWLGEQGLVNSNTQTRMGVANYKEEIKAGMVHAAVVPGCLWLSLGLRLTTGLTT